MAMKYNHVTMTVVLQVSMPICDNSYAASLSGMAPAKLKMLVLYWSRKILPNIVTSSTLMIRLLNRALGASENCQLYVPYLL